MSDAKEKYRRFCEAGIGVPIFSRPWWLDAVAGCGGWDVTVIEDSEGWVASMPYTLRRKFGLSISTQPRLTPSLGPWIRSNHAVKESTRLSYEKRVMSELVSQLPRIDYFLQKWHYSLTNWLPFHWEGFRQTTRYTSVIDRIDEEELVWRGMDQNIRAEIKKARERFGLSVREGTVDEFLLLNKMTFARQNMELPYGEALVRNIEAAASARACRSILVAEDGDARAHAAIFLVWDEASAYYLMGGADPGLRHSGASSLCMWEGIRLASRVTRAFDFEGSMIEPVSRFFRAFGARQTPYSQIKKVSSPLLRLADAMRGAA
jgi:hypothetical protein